MDTTRYIKVDPLQGIGVMKNEDLKLIGLSETTRMGRPYKFYPMISLGGKWASGHLLGRTMVMGTWWRGS